MTFMTSSPVVSESLTIRAEQTRWSMPMVLRQVSVIYSSASAAFRLNELQQLLRGRQAHMKSTHTLKYSPPTDASADSIVTMKGEASLPGIYVIKSLVTTNGLPDEKKEPEKPEEKSHRQWMCAIIVSLASMTYGTALGWPSPVLVKMTSQGDPFPLNPSEVSWMVSIVYVTNLLSPLPAGALMDALGRKQALILLTLPALISWPIALLATDARWLYLSRLLIGAQGGAVTTITPTYVAETASAKHRGAMNTMGMFFVFVGIFYSYIIGHLVSYPALCFFNGLIPLIFIVLFSAVPDTPYWYIMSNQHQAAEQSLSWLNSTTPAHIQQELTLIEQGVHQQISNKNSFTELLLTPSNRKALMIVLALTFTQRMSGFGSLLAFGATALPDLGWISAEQCNILVGAVWMITIPLAGYLMDIFGRKPLIIISSLGTFISMTIIGCYFYFSTPYLLTTLNFIPFLFTVINSFLFSIGLGPIALLLPSELFPANVKAKASAIASICQASSAFLSNIIWLDFLWLFFGSPSSFTLKPKIVGTSKLINLMSRSIICDRVACAEDRKQRAITVKKKRLMLLMMMTCWKAE
ncbi:hypothetical protein LSTR_LSTR012603 [Laodelphax striatellus]|uniref:Major facilitator superfamily (MFS) profile domain-containing protein n=1 Tax=Laodelphax striatellus TaxID=195883 RepID=A0A482X0N2_LAOST|nr:hypothetical protein LSTR_LSTR012603 [Laodelphax striatellus]